MLRLKFSQRLLSTLGNLKLILPGPIAEVWWACRYDDSFKPAEDDGTPWLEGLFEGAQEALQQAEDRVSAYMAAKVQSWSLHLISSPLSTRNFTPLYHPITHMPVLTLMIIAAEGDGRYIPWGKEQSRGMMVESYHQGSPSDNSPKKKV